MKFNMPMAVFGGLALIAAAIYFGPGSAPVSAYPVADDVQKVVICESAGIHCAGTFETSNGMAALGVWELGG